MEVTFSSSFSNAAVLQQLRRREAQGARSLKGARIIGSLFGLCKARFGVFRTVFSAWIKYSIHARQLTFRSKRKIQAPIEKATIS